VITAESGKCSFYTGGGTTASGEPFNEMAMTAAHKTLPFNTNVRVNGNGGSVVVRINDRGPFVPGRILDLAKGAAIKLNMLQKGVVDCTVEKV
jgi:rare lipoprotein A